MEDEDFKIVNLYNKELKVFRDGRIYNLYKYKKNTPQYKKGDIKTTKYKTTYNPNGYAYLTLSNGEKLKKKYLYHRIIALAFLGLDIDNPKMIIDHIDRNRKNKNWLNLRIVTNQQNCFNTSSQGYSWDKSRNKYEVKIKVNNKSIHLGRYGKEEDARQAYIDAKKIYHKY